MGFRSLLSERRDPCLCLRFLSYAYTIHAVIFMLIGYLLQYMSCFRRDRGFWYVIKSESLLVEAEETKLYGLTCEGSSFFSFVIPSVLHLVGYLHAVYIFHCCDDEQLPILMERVR